MTKINENVTRVLVFGGAGYSDISIINRYIGDSGPTHISIVNPSLDLEQHKLMNEFAVLNGHTLEFLSVDDCIP